MKVTTLMGNAMARFELRASSSCAMVAQTILARVFTSSRMAHATKVTTSTTRSMAKGLSITLMVLFTKVLFRLLTSFVLFLNSLIPLGSWVDDVRSGNGKYTYANGDIYDGDWVSGVKEGSGSYTYKQTGLKVCDPEKHGDTYAWCSLENGLL